MSTGKQAGHKHRKKSHSTLTTTAMLGQSDGKNRSLEDGGRHIMERGNTISSSSSTVNVIKAAKRDSANQIIRGETGVALATRQHEGYYNRSRLTGGSCWDTSDASGHAVTATADSRPQSGVVGGVGGVGGTGDVRIENLRVVAPPSRWEAGGMDEVQEGVAKEGEGVARSSGAAVRGRSAAVRQGSTVQEKGSPENGGAACPKKKRKKDQPPGLKLWQFILKLLLQGEHYSDVIQWTNRDTGTFKVLNSEGLARIWGAKRGRKDMNYDKMSRAMRYYYNKHIMDKAPRRLHYQFKYYSKWWEKLQAVDPNFKPSGGPPSPPPVKPPQKDIEDCEEDPIH